MHGGGPAVVTRYVPVWVRPGWSSPPQLHRGDEGEEGSSRSFTGETGEASSTGETRGRRGRSRRGRRGEENDILLELSGEFKPGEGGNILNF